MIGSKNNITYLIERSCCCAAFLALFYIEIHLCIKAGAWVQPPMWVVGLGGTLMGANIASLLANFKGGSIEKSS